MAHVDLYSLSAYQYNLPEELIAQRPIEPRDSSRLMIVDRKNQQIQESNFRSLLEILGEGDGIVFNDTKVVPSRLIGRRKSGGQAEVFLTRRHHDGTWDALVRPSRKMPPGTIVTFAQDFSCEISEVLAHGERRVRFHCLGDLDKMLEVCGQIPLPHYIRRDPDNEDREGYQTVYAANPGAVAAPTAGLHFTNAMLTDLEKKGVLMTRITLHVGLGTFRPVQTEDIRAHMMHRERYVITPSAATLLNEQKSDKLQICVGTTCCRTLESAINAEGIIEAGTYDTNMFIYPGYQFRYVKGLLTNFHLPGSTLLMLVCAYAGYELAMEAYNRAVKQRFRFFSYGDAMLIL